jgi:hypothetical protein
LFYYRLRLARPDGSLDNAVPTVISSEGANATVSIFPNPVVRGQQAQLQYPAAVEGAVVFRFFDTLGRRVLTQSLNTTAGLNVFPLSLDSLIPGFYVMSWQDTQGKTGGLKFVRL